MGVGLGRKAMVVIEGCVVLDDTRFVFAVVTPSPLAQSFICIYSYTCVEYPRVYIIARFDKLNPQNIAPIHVNFQFATSSQIFDFSYTSNYLTNTTWLIAINSGPTLCPVLASLVVRRALSLQELQAAVSLK